MSTLTSSPSPAASPRTSFHIQRGSYPSYPYTSPSQKPRAFHALATPNIGSSGSKQRREHYVESSLGEKTQRYVDAGTQYSPDGYPPTAGREYIDRGKEKQQRLGSSSPSAKKRKEPVRSATPEPMSTSSSSGSSARELEPPPEPEPRRDPTPATSRHPATTAAGPSLRPNTEVPDPSKRAKPEPGSVKVMPILYQDCNAKELGVLISTMLMELIRLNDEIPLRDGRLTRFHSRAPPGISVNDYLQRLIHHATLHPSILLSMVWYIDRLCQFYPTFTINSLTVHRFLITSATVAAKGLSDSFWTNPTYAKIGGIPVSELATLETEFLTRVDWKIVPKPEDLEDYYRSLVERTDGYELERAGEASSGSTSVVESDDGEKDEDEPMADHPS